MEQDTITKAPKCRKCGETMEISDIDFNFPGNQNNYWSCPNEKCDSFFEENIRYWKVIKSTWYEGEIF